MSIFSPHSRSSSYKSGFTLIELLVVMAIMSIITGTILLRQAGFNSATLLRSLGYSVALSVRQAQIYGVSVYGTTTSTLGAPVYAPGYGLSFSSGDNTHYVLFADLTTGNYSYTTAFSNQVKVFSLGKGFYIKSFCGVLAGGSRNCSTDSIPITYLTVLFKRPNPDAYFFASDGASYVGAYIQISSTEGSTRSVTISSSGQIVVGAIGT